MDKDKYFDDKVKQMTDHLDEIKKEAENKEKPEKKLSQDEFILLALKTLVKPPYSGFHNVHSYFNMAFRRYFKGADPVRAVIEAEKRGLVKTRSTKGGYVIYPPNQNLTNEERAVTVLKKMGLYE